MKYDYLSDNYLKTIDFNELQPNNPNYFFIPKNEDGRILYENGFSIEKLFSKNVTGIVTMGDNFAIDNNKDNLNNRISNFLTNEYSEEYLNKEFGLGKNYAKWILENKSKIILVKDAFTKIAYRPFDDKWTYFDNKLIWRWRYDVNRNFFNKENLGLVVGRQSTDEYWCNVQISKLMIDNRYHFSYKGTASQFPLYIYPETNGQQTIDQTTERTPNLNPEIVKQIADKLGLTFLSEKSVGTELVELAPIDILDYIYAVLHSPTYREKYKEFLKIDFPRVPYPKDAATFWQLVKLGGQIRQIHLLESSIVEKYITGYPEDGDNVVGKPKYDNGKVYINDNQYFSNVPEVAWNFYIGGYQPAQKWLKDRKDRKLEFDDILHYQKIIVALTETDRLMKEIDKVEIE
jgi:predicted helicase